MTLVAREPKILTLTHGQEILPIPDDLWSVPICDHDNSLSGSMYCFIFRHLSIISAVVDTCTILGDADANYPEIKRIVDRCDARTCLHYTDINHQNVCRCASSLFRRFRRCHTMSLRLFGARSEVQCNRARLAQRAGGPLCSIIVLTDTLSSVAFLSVFWS